MKLDDLKVLWDQSQPQEPRLEPAELKRMMQAKSHGAVAKIRRNFWLEIILLIMLGIGALLWFALRSLPVSWWEWLGFTLLIPFNGLFYWYKFRTFLLPPNPAEDLRASLDRYVGRLERYLVFYRALLTYLVPVLSVVGMFYGFSIALFEDNKSYADLPGWVWVLFAAVAVAYTAFAYWFSHWIVDRMYGKHLRTLQGVQAELHEFDSSEQQV